MPARPGDAAFFQEKGRGGIDNRIGWRGYRWDPVLGLWHCRNRDYDPRRGRWLQRDPLGLAGGPNLYEYCGGMPWDFADPWGLSPDPSVPVPVRELRSRSDWQALEAWGREHGYYDLVSGHGPNKGKIVRYTYQSSGYWTTQVLESVVDGYDHFAGSVEDAYSRMMRQAAHSARVAETVVELTARTLLEPVDMVMSVGEFIDQPGWINAAAIIPFIPGGLKRVDELIVAGGGTAKVVVKVTDEAGSVVGEVRFTARHVGGKTVLQRGEYLNLNIVDQDGLSNRQRMQIGKAPIGPDGEPIHLHHYDQLDGGPIMELTYTEHRQLAHPKRPSAIDRGRFDSWREQYWKERLKQLCE